MLCPPGLEHSISAHFSQHHREPPGSSRKCPEKSHRLCVSTPLSHFGRGLSDVPRGLSTFSRIEHPLSWRLCPQTRIFKSTEICQTGKGFILSHFSILQITIYATGKKAILFTEVSLYFKNSDHNGATSPVEKLENNVCEGQD